MKRIGILFSLLLYLFGASYFVHVNAMAFSDIEKGTDIGHCHEKKERNNSDKNIDGCLEKCVGQYGELSYLNSLNFDDIYQTDYIYTKLILDKYFEKIDDDNVFFVNGPPDNFLLYKGFVGKVTILLI
ncbi:hypothetical protein K9M48_02585 [Candidatus Gracilibacteria bacterium]|nr:hypothetical protein [Candidatus Gracilibacteria bacterium]